MEVTEYKSFKYYYFWNSSSFIRFGNCKSFCFSRSLSAFASQFFNTHAFGHCVNFSGKEVSAPSPQVRRYLCCLYLRIKQQVLGMNDHTFEKNTLFCFIVKSCALLERLQNKNQNDNKYPTFPWNFLESRTFCKYYDNSQAAIIYSLV